MRVNKLEAELILYHITTEANFGWDDVALLRIIVTEVPEEVEFTAYELWHIIRGVPVEGDFAKLYHELKVKTAKALATEYKLDMWRTPEEVKTDDKQLEEMFNANQGKAQGDSQGGAGQEGGTETGRVLPRSEDQDSADTRSTDPMTPLGRSSALIDCGGCDDCTCQEDE